MKKKVFLFIFFALFIAGMFYVYTNDVYAKPDWLTSEKVSCGPVKNIPVKVPEIFSLLILLLQIAVPIILVIFGMIDLSKGVMSQKEDEIKKGQQSFIKRIIAGCLVFFIVALVKILIGAVGGDASNKEGITACLNCFLNGECTETTTNGGNSGGVTVSPNGGIASPENTVK